MSFQALIVCGWKQPFSWMQIENTQYSVPALCISYLDKNVFITKRDHVLSYKEWKVILNDRGKAVLLNIVPIFHSPSHNLVMFEIEDKSIPYQGCFYQIKPCEMNFSTSRGKIEIHEYEENKLTMIIQQKIMVIKKMVYKKISMEDQNIYVELENSTIPIHKNVCGTGMFHHGILLGMIIANDTRPHHFLMMPTNNILHFLHLYKSGLNQFQIVYPDLKDITSFNAMTITNKMKPPDTSIFHSDFGCHVPLKYLFWYHALDKMTITHKNKPITYQTQFANNIYPLTSLPLHLNRNWTFIPYHQVEYEMIVDLSGDVMQSIVDTGLLNTNRLTKTCQEFFDGVKFEKKRIAFNSLISSFRMIDYLINYLTN